jgi:hypothetical protein
VKKLSPKLCRQLLGLNCGLEFDEKGNLKTYFYPMVGSNLWAEELLNELSPKSREKYLQLEKEVAEKQDQLMEQMFEYREKAGADSTDERKPLLSEDSLKLIRASSKIANRSTVGLALKF